MKKLLSFLLVFLIVSLFLIIPIYAETFGKTDVGTSSTTSITDYIYGSKYTLAESGTVTSMAVYCQDSTNYVRVAIYAADGAGGDPSTLKCESASIPITEDYGVWVECDVPDTVLTADDYWLVVNSDGGNNFKYAATGSGIYKSQAYGAMPNPFGTKDGPLTREYSIYATYTPSGQDLTFNLYENSKTFGSTSKNIEITRTLYETPKTFASATASFQLAYLDLTFILFGAGRTFASNFLNKELTFKLFDVSKTWSSITSSFEGIAQDLTFILFESAKTWASIVATLPTIVYTVNDLIPLVVLGFIISMIALAIAIMWSLLK
jgi:hypothetical protein